MKEPIEKLGLVFGGISVVLFWAPPIGIGLGIAGLVISISNYRQNRRLRKTAISVSALGILMFIAFWGAIWLASQ